MGRFTPLHYRRSLASRVTLLTTMAVGIAVTGVAFAAYATVRMQSMNSIDRSLHTRASAAANPATLLASAGPAASRRGPWAPATSSSC